MASKSILRRPQWFATVGWMTMAIFAGVIAVDAGKYLRLDAAYYFGKQREVYATHWIAITLHAAGGIVALLVGPGQFLSRWQTGSRSRWHRRIGKLYLSTVALTGFSGIFLSFVAYGGYIARIGFLLLACLLLASSLLGYLAIRRGKVAQHRRWMTRSYAMIFGAVTLRLWLIILGTCGVPFLTSYQIAAWISWGLNLLVVEMFFRNGAVTIISQDD